MIPEMIITNNNLPLLSQLDPLMRASLARAMAQTGEDLTAQAVKAIQSQIAPDGSVWAALADWWEEYKVAKGYSNQIYIMTSSYLQAITWRMADTGWDYPEVIIGVMRDAGPATKAEGSKKGSEKQIFEIAEILEYGWEQFNVKIPPRPIWRPLIHVNEHKVKTRVGVAIYWAAKKVADQAKGSIVP